MLSSFVVFWRRHWQAHPYHLAAAGLLTAVAAIYYLPYLTALPTGIHTWAQCDRLALAINYYDFGFRFFTPRTSALVSIGGITGVEFPLQAYLAALGGLVVGRAHISVVFRLLDVAATVLGFFYLFRLVFERTGHFVAGLVPAAFLLASPFFAFYAGNFLPDPFSLSLSFVGYYYWLRFFDERRFADLRRALLVLVLAGLIKTTTALHFGAVAGITFAWAYFEPGLFTARQRRWFLVWVGLGAAAIGLMLRHNLHLNEMYDSWQFRAAPNPLETPDDWHAALQKIRVNWLLEYAIRTQYWVLAGCLGLLLLYVRPNLRRYRPLTLLLLASVGIAYVFFALLGASMGVHDYYALCSFVPPALLLLLLALLNVGRYVGWRRTATSLGLGGLAVFLVVVGHHRLQQRMSDHYLPHSRYYSHQWMRGGAAEMRRATVPATARVLYLAGAVNTAQVYFDRRGISWTPYKGESVTTDKLLELMAADSLDYLVLPPAAYTRLAAEIATLRADFTPPLALAPAVILRRRTADHLW